MPGRLSSSHGSGEAGLSVAGGSDTRAVPSSGPGSGVGAAAGRGEAPAEACAESSTMTSRRRLGGVAMPAAGRAAGSGRVKGG